MSREEMLIILDFRIIQMNEAIRDAEKLRDELLAQIALEN